VYCANEALVNEYLISSPFLVFVFEITNSLFSTVFDFYIFKLLNISEFTKYKSEKIFFKNLLK